MNESLSCCYSNQHCSYHIVRVGFTCS